EAIGSAVSDQAVSVEAIGSAVSDQAVSVEEVKRLQLAFNEKVLDRVRAVEHAVGQLALVDEKVLDRVRALESKRSDPSVLRGQLRRLQHASLMIADARQVMEGLDEAMSEASQADRCEEPLAAAYAPDPIDPVAPVLSVIVSCFNEESFVSEALDSILQQSFEQWECIVVDDASTDRSVDRIVETTAGDHRFRLIESAQNRGVSAARNAGMAEARGRYVIFHDADDLMMPGSLGDRVEVMEAISDPDVAGVFCGVRIVDEGLGLEELSDAPEWNSARPFVDFVSSNGECPFGPTPVLLRTSIARALGGFPEDDQIAEDWEFWLRIMRRGFYFVPSRLKSVAYRQKATARSQSNAAAHVDASYELIDSAYSEYGLDGAKPVLATYPFPDPLPRYQKLVTRSRRTIQYAAMALMRADLDAYEPIVRHLEHGSWPVIRRHIDIERVVSDGVRRATGLDPLDLPHLEQDLAPLRAFVVESVRRATEC
ncbi:MAG: glycosyltransferase, partial [Actinomycetia bacterium]|nr:glycosyltransferase [Actinomycetes bacterium]